MKNRVVGAVIGLAIAASVAGSAWAVTPLVNPAIIPVGGSIHLTPHGYDQNGIEVSLSGIPCTLAGYPGAASLPVSLVTITYDATGATLMGVGIGTGTAKWTCSNQGAVVASSQFTVTVNVPWSVTSIGDTTP